MADEPNTTTKSPPGEEKGSKAKPKAAQTEAPAASESFGNHFLVANIGNNARVGSKIIIMHAAKSINEATKYIENLENPVPEYVCILEQKAYFARKPKITLAELEKDAVTVID